MKRTSLKNIEAFRITDSHTNEVFYGCNQEWFGTHWQRLSGCGPSVVSNLILYRTRTNPTRDDKINDKASCLSLMEEVWGYVRPTPRGIPSTELLCGFVKAYGLSKDERVVCSHCEIPDDSSLRPSSGEVVSYIERALDADAPVAFLNLCNGDENNLDEWHWVTIVSLARSDPGGHAMARILDKGGMNDIDLTLWLDTTQNGGGFVYFTLR
ncbi:MAG: hypothetical protein LBT23_00710 [Synergistaceae bacterium]|jgi:hypothetical protein|nr:hypothetical protein [Synergistaceae bacterium]